ncbi:hypothetical protein Scani_33470 [Streptomyces caniferus]|uniref:Uncharacterized protein n=1 Tax=Streptomyces caniferus TaxID=285557 RepID=A0A640S765_9ACTN|nr:hypothetical protein Scani_33470 [Streptomyces caniferus]
MVAVLVPKCTEVAPPRLVPVMVTVVPPPVDPWLGEIGMVLLLRCGVRVGMTNRDRTAVFAVAVMWVVRWSIRPIGRPGRQVQPMTLPDGAQLSGVLPLTLVPSRVTPPELT